MDEAGPQRRIALLGAPPVLGALIASYFRVQFKDAAVAQYLSTAELDGSMDGPCAFVLIESSATDGVHGTARAVERVRALGAQGPILVAAASPNRAAAAEALRCGAQGFVPNLVPISMLGDALRTVLEGGTCFPQSDCLGSKFEEWRATPGPLQRSSAERRLPGLSVELAVMSDEMDAGYVGPCRRRAANDSWSGPERRRAVRR